MYILRPIIVGGFGGVRVRRVVAVRMATFAIAIGEAGELLSWGSGRRPSRSWLHPIPVGGNMVGEGAPPQSPPSESSQKNRLQRRSNG
jgi:hypothetical protein